MNHPVPTFSLYGEAHAQITREFLHIESIFARSAQRNWRIDAHRHDGLFQLLFVFSGYLHVWLDGEEHEYHGPVAVIVPPGVVHAFKFMSQTDGYVLTLDDSGLGSMAGSAEQDDTTQAFSHLRSRAMALQLGHRDGAPVARVRGLLSQLMDEFARPGPGSPRMYVWLVRALLLLLVREQIARRMAAPANERYADWMQRFRQLVDEHYREQWPVGEYARALNLTESRLNRICRRESGCSAFDVIQARLVLEIRRKLVFTAMPMSRIAYELGFSDPAYFTRYVKKMMGVTPSDFRNNILAP